MVKKPQIAIIGAGNIGSEVYRMVREEGWDVGCVVDVDGVFRGLPKTEKVADAKDYQDYAASADLAFLAIPTFDDGATAFSYIRSCLERGVPVVTCEKGALSNYYAELEKNIRRGRIGFNATVGGGTRMLKYASERAGPRTERIHAVLNGTLNYIFERLEAGISLDSAVEEAQERGYAEPGVRNPLAIINKEAMDDVRMKAAILFNACHLSRKRVRAKDIETRPVKESELKTLVKDASPRRYIVTLGYVESDDGLNAGFDYRVDKTWMISAGFRQVGNDSFFSQLKSSDAGNAIRIKEFYIKDYGDYLLKGPGAGAGPTAYSMMLDAKEILRLK